MRAALVNSLFTQKGFTPIDRTGALVDVNSRPEDWVATSARLGFNAYTNGWGTPVGGLSTEFFPVHWLDVGGGAEFFNLVDFQPPFGIGIYDLVTTIGGAGAKISSTQGTLHVRLRPRAGWTIYARSRVASLSDGNLFQDDFAEASYEFRPGPLHTRMGAAYYFLALAEDAPLYRQVPGGPVTPAYWRCRAGRGTAWRSAARGISTKSSKTAGSAWAYSSIPSSNSAARSVCCASTRATSPRTVD